MDFKTGYILETYTPLGLNPMSWLSNLIRFFCKTKYSHTGIIVMNWDMPFINEAIGKGVIASPLMDKYKGHNVRISSIEHNLEERYIAQRANSKIGITGYDFSGLLWYQLVYQLTGHWFGYTTEARASEKFYCYEFVCWTYNTLFPQWYKLEPKQMNESPLRKTLFEGKL